MPRIYADHNATSPLRPEARAAMLAAMEITGNPSSVHKEGRAARQLIEDARGSLARIIGANSRDIFFTSGGTEAANLGIYGLAHRMAESVGKPTIFVSALEHEAVQKTALALGYPLRFMSVTRDGVLDLTALKSQLAQEENSPLVCLTLANNETGVIQPVTEAAQLVHDRGGRIFCDGVQGLGKIPVDVAALGADAIGFSAHKVGGPQGSGAVWVRSGVDVSAHIHGGGQEAGRRSGTQNVLGIAGFAAAALAAISEFVANASTLRDLRDSLEIGLMKKYPDADIMGGNTARLPNTLNISIGSMPAETRVIMLDLAGIAASAGSACSSGKAKTSGVIEAMGYADGVAKSAIRFSFGYTNTKDDIEKILSTL